MEPDEAQSYKYRSVNGASEGVHNFYSDTRNTHTNEALSPDDATRTRPHVRPLGQWCV